jgi:hypothetical protein
MSTDVSRTKVDLDLDALQPEGKTLRFQGKIYRLPAEIPIPIINRALQLSDKAAVNPEGDAGMVGIETLQPPGYEDEAEAKEGDKALPPTAEKKKSTSRSRKPSPAASSN